MVSGNPSIASVCCSRVVSDRGKPQGGALDHKWQDYLKIHELEGKNAIGLVDTIITKLQPFNGLLLSSAPEKAVSWYSLDA